MPKYTFYGKINPERVPVTIPNPFNGKGSCGFLRKEIEFRVAIHASQCVVDLSVDDEEVADVYTLRNFASEVVGNITDLIGYLNAYCFDVEILSCIRRDNDEWFVFGIDIPVLAHSRPSDRNELSVDLLRVVGHDLPAQMVLADFRKAIRDPVGTGFYCYRCAEAIMQSFKDCVDAPDSTAWEKMRGQLRIHRTALNKLKAHADFPRHGRPLDISDSERCDIFRIVDEIIRRYLIYIVSNGAALGDDYNVLMYPLASS